MISLIDGIFTLSAHLTILINNAMNAALSHGFRVVNVLRSEATILFEYQLHT